MTDQEILAAMASMLEPLRSQMARLEGRMTGFEDKMTGLEEKVTGIEGRMTGLEDKMTRLEVSYENQTQRIINLLSEDYTRVAAAVIKTSDYDETKSTVKDHDRALVNHNRRITKLEKKAI